MKKSKNVLLCVDGLNILHRGHYTSYSSGGSEPSAHSIKGMLNIILADIRRVKATHVAVIFDRPGGNFRYDIYPEYKKGRKLDGPNFYAILPTIKKVLNLAGIKVYGKVGIEGDDMIASVAARGSAFCRRVYISSNDKDFASMVNDIIHLLKPKGVILDESGVFKQYGVYPEQMVEYLMMLGDKVDNVPGINKVGHVTASKLLNQHGSLKHIYQRASLSAKMRKNFDEARPKFKLTRKLITLQTNLMDHITADDVVIKGPQPGLKRLCAELDFHATYHDIVKTLG